LPKFRKAVFQNYLLGVCRMGLLPLVTPSSSSEFSPLAHFWLKGGTFDTTAKNNNNKSDTNDESLMS
jgi:hypothetical protein